MSDEICDIARLGGEIDGTRLQSRFVSWEMPGGVRQINMDVPEKTPLGTRQFVLRWDEAPISPPYKIQVVPSPPLVPRIVSVTDGIEVTIENVVHSDRVQVTLTGVGSIDLLSASVDALVLEADAVHCEDPVSKRYKVNFRTPAGLSGICSIHFAVGDNAIGSREVRFVPRSLGKPSLVP